MYCIFWIWSLYVYKCLVTKIILKKPHSWASIRWFVIPFSNGLRSYHFIEHAAAHLEAFFPADLKHAHNIRYSKSSWTQLTCHHHAHQTNKPQMNSIFFVLVLGSLMVIGVSSARFVQCAWHLSRNGLGPLQTVPQQQRATILLFSESKRVKIPYLCTSFWDFLGWFLKQMFSVHADIVGICVCMRICLVCSFYTLYIHILYRHYIGIAKKMFMPHFLRRIVPTRTLRQIR